MGDLKYSLVFLVVAVAAIGCSDGGTDDASFMPGSQQCLGPSDMAILPPLLADAGVPDGGGGATLILRAQENCGRYHCFDEVLSDQNPPVCLQDCMDMILTEELSSGCRDCFVFSITCGASNCVVPCLADTIAACVECTDTNCTPTLNDCIGYTP